MKLRSYIYLLSALFLIVGCGTNPKYFSYKDKGIVILHPKDSTSIHITPLNPYILEIEILPNGVESRASLVVNPEEFDKVPFTVKETSQEVVIETEGMRAQLSLEDYSVTYTDANSGEVIVKALDEGKMSPVSVMNEKAFSVSQSFMLDNLEGIYGLGQYQNGVFNYRDTKVNLVQANMEIAIPYLVSTKNYGIYWDNYSKTEFEEFNDRATFSSEVANGIRYYLVYGKESLDQVIAGYRELTGDVPMQAKSFFGYWQSKERYKSFDELVEVLKEYRKRNIPIDNIVQDWEYWGEKEHWNSLRFDETRFPNAKENIATIQNSYNVKVALSVWPGFGKDTEVYSELDSIGALFDEPTWADYKVVDIFNPKAQKIMWDNLYKGLYTKGIDIWWMDATEPSFIGGQFQDKQEAASKSAGMTYWGPFHRYLNVYSLEMSKMMYEGLRSVSDKRVAVLTRSSFAGQQKYGTTLWSGDIYASWRVLKNQLAAGLNVSLTGQPYWTSDIGAFYVTNKNATGDGGFKDPLSNPAYKELYVRWFQYGAFTPLFRAHGTNIPREVWRFGEPGTPYYDALIESINLRYKLLSYIYSEAWQVTKNRSTMMRPLVMDFGDDTTCYNLSSAYMFGKSLLVVPITAPQYTTESGSVVSNPKTEVVIYLPSKKQGWYDFYSGAYYKGGQSINYDAPLNKIPLFVKEGSIIPVNEVVPYVNAEKYEELTLLVYSGADASYTLYEDDNETFNYENGEYCEIVITWNEQENLLSFSAPQGNYSTGDKRLITIELITPTSEGKVVSTETITYTNEKMDVVL